MMADNGAYKAGMVEDSGQRRLERMGYKQELRRGFNGLANFGIMFAVASVMTGSTAAYGIGFNNGQGVAIVYTWIMVGVFSMCICASLAEICSSLPTSGSMYVWAYFLGGRRYGTLAAWVAAWMNLLGWVAGCSSVGYACASIIQTMILIATGGADGGGYYLTNAQLLGVFAAILIIQGCMNSAGGRVLAYLNYFAIFWNVFGTLTMIVLLPSVAVKHQSAAWVFTNFARNPEYDLPNSVYAFLVGITFAQYTIGGFDAAAHMSEETRAADFNAAKAMIWSLVISLIIGFGYILAITFSIQDATWDNINGGAAGGYVVGQIFYDIFVGRFGSSKGAVAALSIPMVAIFFAGLGCQTAQSRMTWAFARDRALPASFLWRRVSKRTGMPIMAVWLSVALSFLISLPLLKSAVAFNAVLSIGIGGGFASYLVAFLCKILVAGRTFQPGPVSMGRWSIPVNIVASIWIVFILAVTFLPTVYPVNSQTLNYTPVAFGIVLIGSLVYWYFPGPWGARNWFKGPVPTLDATAILNEDGQMVAPTAADAQWLPGEEYLKQ